MDFRRPAAGADVSPSRNQPTPGDALCKVAFVNINVDKATLRTSCRSTASSDSDESVTSSTLTTTSSSRDSDDKLPPSSTSTWRTYIYFYPRHDMTYTHCLLTTSRHIDCNALTSTSSCWPCLSAISVGGSRPGRSSEETVSPGVANRWQRRVNAARTPFWFPVARSYDTVVPAYFYYPRHDLSYAEVEASRVDRQPRADQSSLPFNTILEELPDDATSLDDRSYVLEDRKSLVNYHSDIVSVRHTELSRSPVPDHLRSTTSSLSACYSDEDPTQSTVSLASQIHYDNATIAVNETADDSLLVFDHEIISSDRRTSPRYQTVDTILTPITKLDLKSLKLVTSRQHVDSGRTRAVCRSSAVDKVRVAMRRSMSDPAVRTGGQQSPVREQPLSARVIKHRNQFSAADEDGFNDVTADGDQACCSPRAAVPLRAKRAVTCLLLGRQSVNNNAAALSPRKPQTSLTDATMSREDVTVSHRTCRSSVAISAPTSSQPAAAAEHNQRHICNSDQMDNVSKMTDESLECGVATSFNETTENVPTEMTSQEMRSSAVTLLVAESLSVDWSDSSSEYLTPPTRREPEMHLTTITRFCDAASQTPLNTEVDVDIVHRGENGKCVTASSTFTRRSSAESPQLYTNVRLTEAQMVDQERSQCVIGNMTGSARVRQATSSAINTDVQFTEVQSLRHSHLEENESELCLPRLEQNMVVTSSPTVTRFCDTTPSVPEKTVHRMKIAYLSSQEHNESVTASDAVARLCDKPSSTLNTNVWPVHVQSMYPSYRENSNMVTVSPPITKAVSPTSTVRTAIPTTEVLITAHSPHVEEKRSVTASATLTRVCNVTLPALDSRQNDSSTQVRVVNPYLEQTEPSDHENKKHGRGSRPAFVDVARRHSKAILLSSDLRSRQSLVQRRKSTSTLRQPGQRPDIERIGPDSLADVGGLSAYVAALTPRNQDTSRRAAVDRRVAGWHRTPSKSYVDIWRKRIAMYEAFVNRCQVATTAAAGAVPQHCAKHWL